jgi:hypothetical protein
MLGGQEPSVNLYLTYLAIGTVSHPGQEKHPITVMAYKSLIPRMKQQFANRDAIFVIPSIKTIHPSSYVRSLTAYKSSV